VDDVIKELRDEGQVFIDVKMAEGLKRGEMSCPQHNNIKFKNMPELKEVSLALEHLRFLF
jgi:hypothetical protein